jgi:hypothetical protein
MGLKYSETEQQQRYLNAQVDILECAKNECYGFEEEKTARSAKFGGFLETMKSDFFLNSRNYCKSCGRMEGLQAKDIESSQ